MPTELSEAGKVIYTKLSSDSQISSLIGTDRIFFGQAPQGTAYPWILYDQFGGDDLNGIGTARIQTELLMLVRVIKQGPLNAVDRTLESRIDAVLQSLVRYASGGYLFSSRRERPFWRIYFDDASNRYSEIGGYYRFYISTT